MIRGEDLGTVGYSLDLPPISRMPVAAMKVPVAAMKVWVGIPY